MKELYLALSAFQEECPAFSKNIDGYGYKYTDLPEIVKTINPILKKHGLVVFQESVRASDEIGVITHLIHMETLQELKSTLTMPLTELKSMNLYQSAGSALTYIRRYDMSNLLGLLSEKDDDGGGSAKQVKRVVKKTKPVEAKKPAVKVKPVLNPESDKWQAAVDYIVKGGTESDITKGYNISKEHMATLMENKPVEKAD